MSQITLFDSPNVTLWFHEDKKIVHHQIKKFVFGEEFHKFLLAGTEAMMKYKAKKWLSDDRNNTVVRKEDIEWGQTNWFPQTVRAGWKYWAIVQPKAVIAQSNMDNLVAVYAQAGIVAQFFSDPDEAMHWLDSQ
jgi:hypothetical protein